MKEKTLIRATETRIEGITVNRAHNLHQLAIANIPIHVKLRSSLETNGSGQLWISLEFIARPHLLG